MIFIIGMFVSSVNMYGEGSVVLTTDSANTHIIEGKALDSVIVLNYAIQDTIASLHYEVTQLKDSVEKSESEIFVLWILSIFAIGLSFYLLWIQKDVIWRKKEKKQSAKNTPHVLQSEQSAGTFPQNCTIAVTKREEDNDLVSKTEQKSKDVETTDIKDGQVVKNEKEPVVEESTVTVKYASIQEDGQGGLKIAERVLSDEGTGKWFMVEILYGENDATYTFNLSAEASILADLQTFRNFTSPFTLSGIPTKIKVIKKGTLVKNGKFWIVRSRLEIDLNY